MGLDAQALTTLTREKFAESLVDNQGKTGVATMSEASEVAKSVISTYQQALIEGNPLILSRIGHLVILDKSARPGRNPKTGEAYEISARRTVSLRKIPLKDKPYLKRQDMLARLRVALSDFSKLNIEDSGYRLITNSGEDGGQEVPHFHIHILAGEKIGNLR